MPDIINERIMKYRKSKKISQKDIAEKLGCNYTTYSQREREGTFHALEVAKIAEIFNVDARLLLYGKIPEPKPFQLEPTPPTQEPSDYPKKLDTTFWVIDKLPRYKDPYIDKNASECIVGYKYINAEITHMEKCFLKMLKQIPKENLKKLTQVMRELEK